MKIVSKLLSMFMHLLQYGSSVGSDVSVMEGDTVTLHSDVEKNQQEVIMWRFKELLIAEIQGDLSDICKNDQCKKRFRDRLSLDQTGSLTITNINTTDSGLYQRDINMTITQRHVTVTGVYRMIQSVKEGESVTLKACLRNKTNNFTWHFLGSRITETGDPHKICTDGQCENSDSLKLDNQTGSLTITNTRNTHSGDYELRFIISGTIPITSLRRFRVTITVSADRKGLYAAVSAVLVFLVGSTGLVYYCKCHSRRKYIRTQRSHQADGVEESSSNQTDLVEENSHE